MTSQMPTEGKQPIGVLREGERDHIPGLVFNAAELTSFNHLLQIVEEEKGGRPSLGNSEESAMLGRRRVGERTMDFIK